MFQSIVTCSSQPPRLSHLQRSQTPSDLDDARSPSSTERARAKQLEGTVPSRFLVSPGQLTILPDGRYRYSFAFLGTPVLVFNLPRRFVAVIREELILHVSYYIGNVTRPVNGGRPCNSSP